MTFTQYLRHLVAMGLAPSFCPLFDRLAWPAHSMRLADFEEYLHDELEVGWEAAILELRTLWSRWAAGPAASANLHADHALVAWRDFAIHLRGCELVAEGPCPRAEALLARAIQESHFHDLAVLPPDRVPCEDPDDAEARYRRDVMADQILGLPSVEEFFHQRGRISSRNRPSTDTKQ